MYTRWVIGGLLGWAVAVGAPAVGAMAPVPPSAPTTAPQAAPPSDSDWQAACAVGARRFVVRFHSPSGDATNDDMRIALVPRSGAPVALGAPPAWYHATTMTAEGVTSVCDGLVATALDNHRVVVWLAADNRPNPDRLTLLLVDWDTGRELDRVDTRAAIKSLDDGATHLTLRRARGGGIEVRLVREVLVRTNDDSAYNMIEDWMRIGVRGDRLTTGWARP